MPSEGPHDSEPRGDPHHAKRVTMNSTPSRRATLALRSGAVDFAALARLRSDAGLRHVFVEDEQEADPFGQIRRGLDRLRAL